MKITKLIIPCMLILLVCSSCRSKKEKAIDSLQTFTENVEDSAELMTDAEWSAKYNEFDAIRLNTIMYKYDQEDAAKIERIEKRFFSAYVKNAVAQKDSTIQMLRSHLDDALTKLSNKDGETSNKEMESSLEALRKSISQIFNTDEPAQPTPGGKAVPQSPKQK